MVYRSLCHPLQLRKIVFDVITELGQMGFLFLRMTNAYGPHGIN